MSDPGEKRLSQSQIDDMFARLAAGESLDELNAADESDSGGSDGDSGMSQDELDALLNGG